MFRYAACRLHQLTRSSSLQASSKRGLPTQQSKSKTDGKRRTSTTWKTSLDPSKPPPSQQPRPCGDPMNPHGRDQAVHILVLCSPPNGRPLPPPLNMRRITTWALQDSTMRIRSSLHPQHNRRRLPVQDEHTSRSGANTRTRTHTPSCSPVVLRAPPSSRLSRLRQVRQLNWHLPLPSLPQ